MASRSLSSASIQAGLIAKGNDDLDTTTSSDTPRLPLELIAEVIDRVHHQPTLAALSLVSRYVQTIATRNLYSSITFSHPASIVAFVRQVPFAKKRMIKEVRLIFLHTYGFRYDLLSTDTELSDTLNYYANRHYGMVSVKRLYVDIYEKPLPASFTSYNFGPSKESSNFELLIDKWLLRLVPVHGPRTCTITRYPSTAFHQPHVHDRLIGCHRSWTKTLVDVMTEWRDTNHLHLNNICLDLSTSHGHDISPLTKLGMLRSLKEATITPHVSEEYTAANLHQIVDQMMPYRQPEPSDEPIIGNKGVTIIWRSNLPANDIYQPRRFYLPSVPSDVGEPTLQGEGIKKVTPPKWCSYVMSVEEQAQEGDQSQTG